MLAGAEPSVNPREPKTQGTEWLVPAFCISTEDADHRKPMPLTDRGLLNSNGAVQEFEVDISDTERLRQPRNRQRLKSESINARSSLN